MTANLIEPRTRRFTTGEYHRMAELGFFTRQRVELIEGELVEMPPQKDPHALAVTYVDYALRPIFPASGYTIRVQLPMRLGDLSEPEPDIAVIKGSPRQQAGHPSTAVLVVEVSESTLDLDRTRKASLYAVAGVQEYWIVNLVEQVVEVRRDPEVQPDGSVTYQYQRYVQRGEQLDFVEPAGALIDAAEFFPS